MYPSSLSSVGHLSSRFGPACRQNKLLSLRRMADLDFETQLPYQIRPNSAIGEGKDGELEGLDMAGGRAYFDPTHDEALGVVALHMAGDREHLFRFDS